MDSLRFTKTKVSEIDEITNINISYWGSEGNYSKKWLKEMINKSYSYSYRDNNQLIAYCLMDRDLKKPKEFIVSFFAVKKGFTGKKIGTKLLEYNLNKIKSNFDDIYFSLQVEVNNAIAIHLYQKLGFQIVEMVKDYYKPKEANKVIQNKNYDAYKMEKKYKNFK